MTDKGKAAAIEELRREVGFGCPVCRSPFLTWHHFDPPWHVEHHWRPEGMIALCHSCHDDADEKGGKPGAYSKDELRAMKMSSRSLEDVEGYFPTWQDKEQLLVRVGGCYTDSSAPVIGVNGEPQIALGKNEAGILSLSFELRNKNDDVVVKVVDNGFTVYPLNVHDMEVKPKTKSVKVWLAEDDVGLELCFKRVSMVELEGILSQDCKRAEQIAAPQIEKHLAQLPAEHRKLVQDLLQHPPEPPAPLPPQYREAWSAKDMIASDVKGWVKKNCVMDDGLIPLLNFEQMAIHFHGKRFVIKNGIADFIHYCAVFDNLEGAINLRC